MFKGKLNGLNSVSSVSSSDVIIAINTDNSIKGIGTGTATATLLDSSNNTSNIKITVKEQLQNGDVNCDGEITVADVVLLQRWLSAIPNTHLPAWKLADLCEDDRLDVFDLVMLKRKLIYG